MNAAKGITRWILICSVVWLALWFLAACANQKEWRTLQEIHGDSLAHFQYWSDKDLYGKQDYWAKPYENVYGGYKLGDCEDYALWVQAKLTKIGFKSMVVSNDNHVFLLVNGWKIDNKYKEIQRRY